MNRSIANLLSGLILTGGLSLGLAQNAQSQVKIGLRLAPTVAYTRVQDKLSKDFNTGDNIKHGNGTLIPSISAGIVVDYFFKPNYALSFNAFYTVKRISVKSDYYGTVDWNLQTIQLPILIKLFTNDIAQDMKLYFQLGASPGFVVESKFKEFERNTTNAGTSFPDPEGDLIRRFDMSLWFGSGIEYRIADQTTLFTGISYNRGLLNMISKNGAFGEHKLMPPPDFSQTANKRYAARADVISIDMGIKF